MKIKSQVFWAIFFSLVFFTTSGFTVVGHRGDPIKYPEEITRKQLRHRLEMLFEHAPKVDLSNYEPMQGEYNVHIYIIA